MPSPFPGMDPWLEHPAFFPGLHDRMIAYLSERLQEQLPAPYYADISDRLWVELSRRVIGPDVKVLRPEERGSDGTAGGAAGPVATAVRTSPVVVTVPHDEFREPFLQIFSTLEGERLVTSIEILSLTNKTPKAKGRKLYRRKQQEVLDSAVNLVEIDLLRAGKHTTAVPQALAIEKAGTFDYHVCVHRFDNLEDYLVYPIRLEDRLPEIEVPLLPGDPPVVADLQSAFDRCYTAGPYRRRLRYSEIEPVPPLDSARRDWANRILREHAQGRSGV